MAKSITVKEVKQKKIDFEETILKMVQDFESDTDTHVDNIWFNRSDDDEAFEEPTGKIKNVEISLRFDL
jgi:hypothetical protein